MKWIKCSDQLPKLSYEESDDADHPYESYHVLVYSPQRPGVMCVAYLVKEQDESRFSFGDLSWECYIPCNGQIIDADFETFTHWMPLPNNPDE